MNRRGRRRSNCHMRSIHVQVIEVGRQEGRATAPPLHAPGAAVAVAHDATLLVAALEELEARRRAIEALLEADLLRRCLG